MAHDKPAPGDTDIEVLREMVRLAENRREEEFKITEKLNQYNLALIGFSGGFLSLIISTKLPAVIVQVSGICLIISILLSLLAIRPRTLRGGTLTIDEDVKAMQEGKNISLRDHLLMTADLLDRANRALGPLRRKKSFVTLFAAIFLAISLLSTYILYAYA